MGDLSHYESGADPVMGLFVEVMGGSVYRFEFDDGRFVDWPDQDRDAVVQEISLHLKATDANDVFAQEHGYADREALLRDEFMFSKMFSNGKVFMRAITKIFSIGEGALDYVSQRRNADGQEQYVRTITKLILRGTGIGGFYGVQWDVTEEHVAQQMLQLQNKQLSCIQSIGRLVELNLPIDDFLTRVADLVTVSVQFPQVAVAAIEFEGHLYGQEEAVDAVCRIAYGLVVSGREVGRVHIAYIEQRPFVAQESTYIRTVAERVSWYIEHTRYEAQLRVSQMAIEQLADGVAVADVDGTVRFVNDSWAKMHGYGVDELAGVPLSVFHTPEQMRQEVTPFNERVLADGVCRGEVGHVRKEGTVFLTLMTVALLRDERGRSIGFVATARDITMQRQMTDALQRSERLLRSVIDATPDWIFIKDREHCYRLINQGYADALHTAPKDVIGKDDIELGFAKELVQGAPEKGTRGFGSDDRQVMESGEALVNPYDPATIDGEVHIFHTIKAPLWDADGNVWGVLTWSRDVTEREQLLADLEQRTRQLQAAAEVSRVAGSILDSEELIRRSVELIRDRFDYYYVGLFLIDRLGEWTNEPGRWAVLRSGTGDPGQVMVEHGHKLEIGGSSMVGQCVALGQAQIALDVGQEARRFDDPLLPKTRSEMALPLLSRGRVIGAVTIQSEREAAFDEQDMTVLQIMADQLAVAIQTAQMFEQAQVRAERERLVRTIAGRIYRATDRDEIIRIALQELGQLLGASRSVARLGTREQLAVETETAASLDSQRGLHGQTMTALTEE